MDLYNLLEIEKQKKLGELYEYIYGRWDDIFKRVQHGDIETVKVMINQGYNVNAKYKEDIDKPTGTFDDISLLSQASLYGQKEICEFLIAKGADVNISDGEEKTTPLMYSVMKNQVDVCELLIKNGANVNAKDAYKNTALMEACDKGLSEICEILIKNGADLNAKDEEGKTSLLRAIEGKKYYVRFDLSDVEKYDKIIKLIIKTLKK